MHVSAGDLIDLQSLPEALRSSAPVGAPPRSTAPVSGNSGSFTIETGKLPYHEAKEQLVDAFEKRYLEDLIERCEGNLAKAARDAGVDRKTIARMLKRHEIVVRGETE